MDQVTERALIGLHVGLAGRHSLALEPERSEVELDLVLLRELVLSAGILRDEDPDHTDPAGRLDGGDEIVHRQVRRVVALVVVRLVADAFTSTIGAIAVRLLQNSIDPRNPLSHRPG